MEQAPAAGPLERLASTGGYLRVLGLSALADRPRAAEGRSATAGPAPH